MKTAEEIQIVKDHMIRIADYPKKNLSIVNRERFSKEINRCRYWLLVHENKNGI